MADIISPIVTLPLKVKNGKKHNLDGIHGEFWELIQLRVSLFPVCDMPNTIFHLYIFDEDLALDPQKDQKVVEVFFHQP
jgi:hypothetical protein